MRIYEFLKLQQIIKTNITLVLYNTSRSPLHCNYQRNDSKCLTPLYVEYEIYVLILKYFLSSLSNLGNIMSKFLLAPTTPSIDMEARGFRRSKSTEVVTPGFPKMHRCMISSFIQLDPLRYCQKL